MAIEMIGILVKHERRIRLVFSHDLAVGAFGSPTPAFYVVENQDGRGPSPNCVAAIIVSGATANVELALDADLVGGALYRVTAIGVPATDLSTSTSASDELFRFGASTQPDSSEPKASDAELLLYGRDAVWTGSDYLESASGDLEEVGGIGNASAALRRRLLGNPLAWAPGYGPRSRQFVDAPVQTVGGLRGELQRQALLDDRVKGIKVDLIFNDATPDESSFAITPTFIGDRTPDAINVAVPTGS